MLHRKIQRRKYTVQVDTREQVPLIFPKNIVIQEDGKRRVIGIEVERVKLDTGDYRLKEAPTCMVIERKGAMTELVQNFQTQDCPRFRRALSRLSLECEYPVMLLDINVDAMFSKSMYPNSMGVWVDLVNTCAVMHITPFIGGACKTPNSRRRLGELMLHSMIWATEASRMRGQL